MKDFQLVTEKKVKLKKPVLIEGLPGLGLVGKIAAEHLISELNAKKMASLYSNYFPPQVIIQKDGTVKMMKDEFYYWKAKKKNQQDLLFIVGDHQGSTPRSHYLLSNQIIDFAHKQGTKTIYTLGGFGTGDMIKKPRVFGAVTDPSLKPKLKKLGVSFEKTGGGIIGAAGLLIGLGQQKKMDGACLMGETHGQIIDARSAKVVLNVLTKLLNVQVDTKELDKRAKETEKVLKKMKRMEQKIKSDQLPAPSEEPTYIR
jgi:hypothetical protein